MAQAKQETREQLQRNVKKWSKPLMEAGWTCIPTVIIHRQQALGLDSVDLNIIVYLASRWWYEDDPPFPSVQTIAEVIGLKSARSVQRHLAKLEDGELIERVSRSAPGKGRMSNGYRLTKLIKAATPFALEEIERREARKAEAAKTLARKKPQLKAVK